MATERRGKQKFGHVQTRVTYVTWQGSKSRKFQQSGAGFEGRQEHTIHFFLARVVVSLLVTLIFGSAVEALASMSVLMVLQVVHIVMQLVFVLNSESQLTHRSESHGLPKFWLDSSKPFLILERVVPFAAMRFLLLLIAAARSGEKFQI